MISAWERSGKTFASVSQNNRVNLYNTVEINSGESGNLRQQLSGDSDLSNALSKYTSIAFGIDPSQKSKKKKQFGLIALGNSHGNIVLWTPRNGEILHTLKSGSSGHGVGQSITALAFNAQCSMLFSSSSDKHICQWNVRTGELLSKWSSTDVISSLAVSPDGSTLASASSTIQLWDLSSTQIRKKLSGHSSPIRCLAFSSDGNFLLSGSSGSSDRFAILWNVRHRKKSPLLHLILDSSPIHLEFNSHITSSSSSDSSSRKYILQCVTQNNKIHLFEQFLSADDKFKSKVVKSAAKIEIESKNDSSSAGNILSSHFLSVDQLIIARSMGVLPSFQTVKYLDGETLIGVTLKPLKSISLMKMLEAKRKKAAPVVSVVGPEENVLADPKPVGFSSKKRKRNEQEEKLAEISGAEDKDASWKKRRSMEEIKSSPKVESMVELLVQSLHTDDSEILSKVLEQSRGKNLVNTAKRLPTQFVLKFLRTVVARFSSSRTSSHSLRLLRWIHAIIQHHTALLMSTPNLTKELQFLYQLVDSRLVVFDRLLKLQGRLQLILSQADLRKELSKAKSEPKSRKPLSVYVAGESDDDIDDNLDKSDGSQSESESKNESTDGSGTDSGDEESGSESGNGSGNESESDGSDDSDSSSDDAEMSSSHSIDGYESAEKMEDDDNVSRAADDASDGSSDSDTSNEQSDPDDAESGTDVSED
uniref:WD repeat-containing protein 43 n=1 Tax=Hirondellea gigas TaxID=1518452 RepID=A0A6A7G0E4_9CRUS